MEKILECLPFMLEGSIVTIEIFLSSMVTAIRHLSQISWWSARQEKVRNKMWTRVSQEDSSQK